MMLLFAALQFLLGFLTLNFVICIPQQQQDVVRNDAGPFVNNENLQRARLAFQNPTFPFGPQQIVQPLEVLPATPFGYPLDLWQQLQQQQKLNFPKPPVSPAVRSSVAPLKSSKATTWGTTTSSPLTESTEAETSDSVQSSSTEQSAITDSVVATEVSTTPLSYLVDPSSEPSQNITDVTVTSSAVEDTTATTAESLSVSDSNFSNGWREVQTTSATAANSPQALRQMPHLHSTTEAGAIETGTNKTFGNADPVGRGIPPGIFRDDIGEDDELKPLYWY